MSPSSKITNHENTSQFKTLKDPNSNRVNDLLIHNAISNPLYDNLITIRNLNKQFEMKGDLLRMITNKNCNVDHASLSKQN